MNIITKYLSLIDDIIVDFLSDLRSHRVVLSWVAIIFNLIVLYMIAFKSVDWKILTVSMGMLTIVYGFYYQSKSEQTKMEMNQDTEDTDSKTDKAE